MNARKLSLAAAGLGLAVILGPASVAAGGGGSTSVVGAGWRLNFEDVPRVEFRIAAQIGPGKALGTYHYANRSGTRIDGTITCGNVAGGVAVVGGHVTSSSEPSYEEMDFYLWFLDNGSPVFGSIGPDQVTQIYIGGGTSGEPIGGGADMPADFPAHCPQAQGESFDIMAGFGLHTVLGEITVR